MKIKETRSGFTTQINPGRFGFFITLDNYGIDVEVDKLVSQGKHFSRIIIKGKEPLEQKDDIYKFVRKVAKENPYTIIEIHTKGLIKPLGLASFNNVVYYVNLQLKNSGIPYEQRIKDNVIGWFIENNPNFIFYIKTKDDIDEVDMLIANYAIRKSQVFIIPMDNNDVREYIFMLQEAVRYCKLKGFNYGFDFRVLIDEVEK